MPKTARKTHVRAAKTTRRRRRPSSDDRRAVELALAAFAHDIRTPLSGILALADLLAASDLPEHERERANAIKDAAEHLARLTTIVVDGARAGTAGLVLQAEPFSPRELAHTVARSLAPRAASKGLDAKVSIARNLPVRARGDAVRLRAALENLIDNAVKFTERGHIGFTATAARAGRGRTRLTFVVSDSGIGVSAADLMRLFRPFAQASEDVARRYGGAGLGLVSVKRVAEAMGGGLSAAGRRGGGSTFKLSVVVEDAAAAPRPHAAAPMRSLRVLCAEDNPYGRIVLNAVLGELGHRASFVGSGEEAVAAVARNEHDVVLMDVALAGIDGIEATRRIRALPGPARRTPIIGVSGRTDPGEEAAARAAGMDGYLHKPAPPAALHEALRKAVGIRRG